MRRVLAAALPVSLIVAGCGSATSSEAGVTAVATVYPLAWVAEGVAPEAEVTLLSAGGLEAHDLAMTPSQRGAVQSADVVLYVGPIGYQPQVEAAVASSAGEVVSLTEVAGPRRLAQGPTGAVDPHIWFAPEVMADAALRAAEAFAAADAANAEVYRRNAEELRAELAALAAEIDGLLGGRCAHQDVFVSHQAYGYLLEPYGFEQQALSGIDPSAGIPSGDLAAMVRSIEEQGVGHVLSEPVEGREEAEAVAREAGVEVLEVSPLDAVTEAQARLGFIDLVREQAAGFATALGC